MRLCIPRCVSGAFIPGGSRPVLGNRGDLYEVGIFYPERLVYDALTTTLYIVP